MGTEYSRGYCHHCQENVLMVRKGPNHILHFLLSLFTCGFWVIIWILVSIRFGGWRCNRCGYKPTFFSNLMYGLKSNHPEPVIMPEPAEELPNKSANEILQLTDEFGRYIIQ